MNSAPGGGEPGAGASEIMRTIPIDRLSPGCPGGVGRAPVGAPAAAGRRTSVAVRYYQELLSYFSRTTRGRDGAADLVQEAYARLLALQRAGQAVAQPRALLYRTVRNLVVDQHRRSAVRGGVPAEDAAPPAVDSLPAPAAWEPETAAASAQSVRALVAAIDALPLRCREAFVLHKFDGLSHAEVAERMGVSRKMVEQHIHRAMQACRQCRNAQDGAPAGPR